MGRKLELYNVPLIQFVDQQLITNNYSKYLAVSFPRRLLICIILPGLLLWVENVIKLA